jgi:predicted metal-dependent phosphoesterase TrpH
MIKLDMHVHTITSKDSTNRYEKIVETCKEKGINGLVISDHNSIDGAHKMQELANGIKIIVGEEIKTKQGEIIGLFLNRKVNSSIKNILVGRIDINKAYRSPKITVNKELTFGRPGKILHVDGDAEYLEVCLKVYKKLELDVTGKVIAEKDQPIEVPKMVKQMKPDIVVIT